MPFVSYINPWNVNRGTYSVLPVSCGSKDRVDSSPRLTRKKCKKCEKCHSRPPHPHVDTSYIKRFTSSVSMSHACLFSDIIGYHLLHFQLHYFPTTVWMWYIFAFSVISRFTIFCIYQASYLYYFHLLVLVFILSFIFYISDIYLWPLVFTLYLCLTYSSLCWGLALPFHCSGKPQCPYLVQMVSGTYSETCCLPLYRVKALCQPPHEIFFRQINKTLLENILIINSGFCLCEWSRVHLQCTVVWLCVKTEKCTYLFKEFTLPFTQ